MIRFADHATVALRGFMRVLAPAGSSSTKTCTASIGEMLPASVHGLSRRLSRGVAGTGGIFSFSR